MAALSGLGEPVWGITPGGLSSYAHSFLPLPAFASADTSRVHIQLCAPRFSTEGAPKPAAPDMPRCPECQEETDRLNQSAPRPAVSAPAYYPHGDPALAAAVAAEFEDAGGKWAALQQRPLDPQRIHREMTAIVREHGDNIPVLLREVIGYLDFAMAAAYEEARQEQAS